MAREIMKKTTLPSSAQIRSLVDTAVGKEKADIAIVGGDVANVYTGEILKNWAVAVKDERIAYVGEDASHTIGPETRVIDAFGKVLIPGLIDGHAHVMHTHATLDEFLRYAIKGGATTIISETLDFCFALGYEGVLDFLESTKDLPIKIFATAGCTFANGQVDYKDAISIDEFNQLLECEEILGVGESNWVPVFRGNDQLIELFAITLAHGKKLEGYGAGAKVAKLAAFVASGDCSDHEPIAADEALERLRLGMHVMIREGDVRGDLEAISKIKNEKIDFRRLAVTTDGIGAKHLIEHGYLNSIVQKAIDLGFDPIVAIQMATLNVAEHFNIDDIVGGIAPGKHADIVIIPNQTCIEPEVVVSKGRVVFSHGELLVEPRRHNYPESARQTVRLPREIVAADFTIRVDIGADEATARIIDLGADIANKEVRLTMSVSDGELKMAPDKDILKVAALDRIHNSGKMFIGLIRGFGLKRGAFAATACWDVSNILVVGVSEEDMAGAVNRLRELQGGTVVYADGHVIAELAMPMAGQTSELSMAEIAEQLEKVQRAVNELGSEVPYAHLTLNTLTTSLVPAVRISTDGLINIKNGKLLDLIV